MQVKKVPSLLMSLAVVAGAGLAPRPVRAMPAVLNLIVNTTLVDALDANPGDGICETASGNGVCTLRAAVREANAYPGADTIQIPAGTYYLTQVATSFENAALDGDLDLTDDVTLMGAGEAATIIDGNRSVTQARVFEILPDVAVTISHLTVRNGQNEPGPGIDGGILNRGTVTVTQVTLTDNSRGGFDNNGGVAWLNHVTYTDNTGNSASLYNATGGVMTVLNSVIANNDNNGASGGVFAGPGQLTLVNTTISGNEATAGGGGGAVVSHGTLTLINSTVSGNRAIGDGGGILVNQSGNFPTTLNLHNVTVAYNASDSTGAGQEGGGIYVETSYGYTPIVNLHNVILANNQERLINSEANDCVGPVSSAGYNLIEVTAGCTINGNLTGVLTGMDPLLGALEDNGGPVPTHLLGGYSPAINAGNPAGCADHLGALLALDQRGYLRTAGGRCDLGAYEAASWRPIVYVPFVAK